MLWQVDKMQNKALLGKPGIAAASSGGSWGLAELDKTLFFAKKDKTLLMYKVVKLLLKHRGVNIC